VVGFAKAIILAVLLHMILGTVLAPESQMLRACTTCDTLNQAAGFTRDLITNEETRKSLLQQKPAIAIDAVKDYLAPGGVGGAGGVGGVGAGDAAKPHPQ
jgi:membrane protein required for colicin V production